MATAAETPPIMKSTVVVGTGSMARQPSRPVYRLSVPESERPDHTTRPEAGAGVKRLTGEGLEVLRLLNHLLGLGNGGHFGTGNGGRVARNVSYEVVGVRMSQSGLCGPDV